MAKQRNRLVAINELIDVSAESVEKTGALNTILGTDTRLFVDPFLLPKTSAPELKDGRQVLLERFGHILKLVASSASTTDATWRAADRLLQFPEPKGFNLGYGGDGSSGSGMGPTIRQRILATAKEVVEKGIQDPIIFELVGIFEEDVGADRISDMICTVLERQFLTYSARIYGALGCKDLPSWRFESGTYNFPKNPYKNEPVLLVPRDILRDLPIAHDYDDISRVCQTNEALRRGVNDLIGRYWHDESRAMPKSALKQLLMENPDILNELITAYKKSEAIPYNFDRDPKDFQISYFDGKRIAEQNPLPLSMSADAPQPEVFDLVMKICERFRENLEDRDLWRDLYVDTECRRPRTEKTAQRLFYTVALEHTDANKIDLTPEANAGRGPVDFKVSSGTTKVLVEVKLAHHKELEHAFETQVPLYQKAERTKDAILLIVKVRERNPRLDRLLQKVNAMDQNREGRPKIIVIDGTPKLSASRA